MIEEIMNYEIKTLNTTTYCYWYLTDYFKQIKLETQTMLFFMTIYFIIILLYYFGHDPVKIVKKVFKNIDENINEQEEQNKPPETQ